MVDLMALQPQQISKNLKGKSSLIYGAPGVGKTTLASKFEKSLILAFEQGTNALNNVYVQPIKVWKDFKDSVKQLVQKPELQERYFTIALDTIDEAHKLCEKFICNKYGVETIKEVAGYGGGYKILDDEFMTPFRDLAYAGYGLTFISHEVEKTFKNDKGEEYNKIIPALPTRPLNLINKMVDTIGYIHEFKTPKADGTYDSKRMLFFRGDDRFLAKSRFKYIVDRIELDYNEYVKAIYDAIDKEVANSGGVASEETPAAASYSFDELMEEARSLWTKILNNGAIDKANEILEKEFGKPTKFSEILPSQIDKLNNVLIEMRELV